MKQFEKENVHFATSISFTSNGKYITFVLNNNTIQHWNIETGETELKSSERQQNEDGDDSNGDDGDDDSGDDGGYSDEGEGGGSGGDNFDDDVVFPPNGKYVALPWESPSYAIELRNIETGKQISLLQPFDGHLNLITCVASSPDGKYAVSGSLDCTIRLWDVETGEVASKPIGGHKESMKSRIFIRWKVHCLRVR